MSRATTEGFISNKELEVNGFVISPDFDTSQQMDISNFIKNIRAGRCKVKQFIYKYKNFDIPVMLMGSEDRINNSEMIKKICDNSFEYHYQYAKSNTKDIENYSTRNHTINVSKLTIDNQDYYFENKKLFYCEVIYHDLILFAANPFVRIYEPDELRQKPEYKPLCGMYLKPYAKYKDSYLKGLNKRQKLLLNKIKTEYDLFEENVNKNGFIIGQISLFLTHGYAILAGTKKDNDTCMNKKVFPFYTRDDILVRHTEEEIENIISEQKEYERKSAIVEKRLLFMESLLREKGYTWTIISKTNIRFEEDEPYSVWMNAQDSDGAHFSWCTEQDFIDWINMEGKIPYNKRQVEHFAKILSEISLYEFKDLTPMPKDKKNYYISDIEYYAKFTFKGTTVKMDLEQIKEKLTEFGYKFPKYTLENFEKDYKKSQRKIFKFK